MIAPIALFVYARPTHVRKTIEALLENTLAAESDLIIFSDAASNFKNCSSVNEVREFLKEIVGFRSIRIHLRPYNFGLSKSIISGVSQVLEAYDRIIVLEDDLLVSPYFLDYMNESLNRYHNDDRVACIHGYTYPTATPLPEAFFLRGADCWGWATWRRGWQIFNVNGDELLKQLVDRRLTKEFDFDGVYPYTDMLRNQIDEKNDSWAIRWYASSFLANKLTLYPGRSLVHNIGNDKSGTHGGNDQVHDTKVSIKPIDLRGVAVEPSVEGRVAFKAFFQKTQAGTIERVLLKVLNKTLSILNINRFKPLVRDWSPPILIRFFQGIGRDRIIYEGPYVSWLTASKRSGGYDAQYVLDKVLEGALTVCRGGAVFERDSVLFYESEYNWPVLTCFLSASISDYGFLNVVDYGGGLGSTYFQHRVQLTDVSKLKWNIIEQKHFVDAGKKNINIECLEFYESLDECLSENAPNVIYCGSSLQYLESPQEILKRISSLDARFLIIDRTPFVHDGGGIVVQRVPASIYSASYPMWILSESELVGLLGPKWKLTSCRSCYSVGHKTTDGITFDFKNLIFQQNDD